jgi:hypothetical protein
LIDLHNTREETISVAELKSAQDNASEPKLFKKVGADDTKQAKAKLRTDSSRRSNSSSEKSADADEDENNETQYRLDPK